MLSRNRLNLFYLLAFGPLALIEYYSYIQQRNIFGALIPLYGVLLLLIKRDKLSLFPDAGTHQRIAGLILMASSFFAYYAVARFHPSPLFYGAANYIIYILGLFLAFFAIPALKESLSAVFLTAAGASSYYVGKLLETNMEPSVPYFVNFMWFVLKALGIPATVSNPRTLMLHTSQGPVPVTFEAGCLGIYSFLTFSVIILVTMMEDSSSRRTKMCWSVAGVLGTFFVNIIRVSLISAVIYHFGYDVWPEVHLRIGYVLFIAWLVFFFSLFSKRQAILTMFRRFLQKSKRVQMLHIPGTLTILGDIVHRTELYKTMRGTFFSCYFSSFLRVRGKRGERSPVPHETTPR